MESGGEITQRHRETETRREGKGGGKGDFGGRGAGEERDGGRHASKGGRKRLEVPGKKGRNGGHEG